MGLDDRVWRRKSLRDAARTLVEPRSPAEAGFRMIDRFQVGGDETGSPAMRRAG